MQQINTTPPWPVFWVASVAVSLSRWTHDAVRRLQCLTHGVSSRHRGGPFVGAQCYTVAYAATLIPSGGLADKHGRKKVFLIGVALFLAASVACGCRRALGGSLQRACCKLLALRC